MCNWAATDDPGGLGGPGGPGGLGDPGHLGGPSGLGGLGGPGGPFPIYTNVSTLAIGTCAQFLMRAGKHALAGTSEGWRLRWQP